MKIRVLHYDAFTDKPGKGNPAGIVPDAGGLSDEQLNALTDRISKEIIKSGFAYIVTTTLRNRKTLRMCIINANTTEDDIRRTVALLDEIAVRETERLRCT